MPKLLQITLLGVALVLAAASADQAGENRDTLNQRAKFDLNCQSTQMVELGENTYGVTGCGRRATYVWHCSGQGMNETCNWVMNGAMETASPAPAPVSVQQQGTP